MPETCPTKDLLDNLRLDTPSLLLILSTVQDGVWVAGADNRILYANDMMARMTGIPVANLIGRNVLKDLPVSSNTSFRTYYTEAWSSPKPTSYNLEQAKKHAADCLPQTILTLLTTDTGQRVIACFTQDGKAEEKQRQNTEEKLKFYEAIVDRIRDGLMIVDHTGKAFKANARMAEMLGYGMDELLELHVWDWDKAWNQDQVLACIANMDAQGILFETRHRRKDGTYLDVEISKSPLVSFGKKLSVCLQRDITQRKAAENRLRESEAALKRAQALARMGSWTFEKASCDSGQGGDESGGFILSGEARRILGLDPVTSVGLKDIFAKIHPDDRLAVSASFNAAQPGKPFEFEHRVVATETIRWVRGRAEVRAVEAGQPTSSIGTILDITESKQLEIALRESERRYRALIETTSDSIWEMSADGRYTAVSPRIEAVLGYHTDDIIGTKPYDILSQECAKKFQRLINIHTANKQPFADVELHYRHKDGHSVIVESSGVPIIDDHGQILGFRGADRDVTARRDAERKLRDSECFLRKTQSVGRIGGWRINPETDSISWTAEVLTLLGLPTDGRLTLAELLQACAAKWRDGLMQRLWRAYRDGEAFAFECPVTRADGRNLWFEFRGSAEDTDGRGRIDNVVGTVQDITEHREALVQLSQAKQHAEAASRAKSNFLASMSHELRTPLNAVIGFSDLLSETETNADRQKQLAIIHQAAKNLLKLIQDILDLTKIEAGRIEVHRAPFNLHETAQDIVSLFDLQAEKKGLILSLNIAPDVPHWIEADEGLLRQILINLIGNAIKFTPKGCIKILVEKAPPENDGELQIIFHIIDTGIGIRPENRERIFEMFEQENSSETREFAGSGLGLAISKRLATLLGGNIWVKSEPGVGSRFSVSVTVAPSNGLPSHLTRLDRRADKGEQNGHWILVVEDDPFGLQLLTRILTARGYHVESASTGADALGYLAMQRFDLVLLDIQLPGLSGIDVAERIRSGQVKGCSADLPLIAVTAYAMRGDRTRFLKLGFDDYVSKPFDRTDLLTKIDEKLCNHGGQSPHSHVVA